MCKLLLFLIIFFISFQSTAEENLLTLKQQLDRLQREVNDLSKSVYTNSNIVKTNDEEQNITEDAINFSAFDMRIYDIEKEIKKLHEYIENIYFDIDEIKLLFDELDIKINDMVISNNQSIQKNEEASNQPLDKELNSNKNTLGTLKINSEDLSNTDNKEEVFDNKETEIKLNPDEEFQIAFDFLRSQKFDQAKISLEKFIKNHPDNKLAGSAHYWLGEIQLLKKNYREAALVFAEGYQKYPSSLKAPDMLFKLSESLAKIDKKLEACNTLSKFVIDYNNHKLLGNAKNKINELECE